jgi:hypothetical protein
MAFADPQGTAYGGSAFSSHLPRTPQRVENSLALFSDPCSRTLDPGFVVLWFDF